MGRDFRRDVCQQDQADGAGAGWSIHHHVTITLRHAQWDAWEADVNVNNLADERYFTPVRTPTPISAPCRAWAVSGN